MNSSPFFLQLEFEWRVKHHLCRDTSSIKPKSLSLSLSREREWPWVTIHNQECIGVHCRSMMHLYIICRDDIVVHRQLRLGVLHLRNFSECCWRLTLELLEVDGWSRQYAAASSRWPPASHRSASQQLSLASSFILLLFTQSFNMDFPTSNTSATAPHSLSF